jgi:pimeloyl-ACP methyl ester carboxylesterase
MPLSLTARGAIGWDETGRADDPPLVLIQGLGSQLVGWAPGFTRLLADAGFRVLRYDNRDVGLSQRFPAGGYTIGDLTDDLEALLDDRGIAAAHVVGQSMGGMVAQELALRHPERVRSLALLYTTASPRHLLRADVLDEESVLPDQLAPTTRERFIPYYVRGEATCASRVYPQDTSWLAELAGTVWDRGWEPDGAARQRAAIRARGDRLDAVAAITTPTVVLAGDADQQIDAAGSVELAAAIPGARLHIYPGLGHEIARPVWDDLVGRIAANAARAS